MSTVSETWVVKLELTTTWPRPLKTEEVKEWIEDLTFDSLHHKMLVKALEIKLVRSKPE